MPCGECRETTPCRACGGTAQWDHPRAVLAAGQEVSADCSGAAQWARPCTGCRGRGRTTCPRCKGTAKITCLACQVRGTTEHAACGGQGQTVTWTEGVITRTPATEQLRRPEALPPFVRSVARAAGEWSSAHLNGDEPLPKGLDPGITRRQKPSVPQAERGFPAHGAEVAADGSGSTTDPSLASLH